MKRLLLLALPVLLSGCLADDSSPEACRYEANQALNQARWDRAIDLLESRSCQSAFAEDERQLNLAAARTGRAGFDMLDILDEVLKDGDGKGGDRMIASFTRMASQRESMTDLDRAKAHRRAIMLGFNGDDGLPSLSVACAADSRDNLSRAQRDACFFNGLLGTAQSAATVGLLIGDDLDAWLDKSKLDCQTDRNSSGRADGGEISSCALRAAGSGDLSTGGSCSNGLTWAPVAPPSGTDFIEFYDASGNSVASLRPIKVTVPVSDACSDKDFENKIRYQLIQVENPDTAPVMTSGFCDSTNMRKDAASANPSKNHWPCPVLRADGSGALTVTETLVTTLNEDAEMMVNALPKSEQDSARESLDEFRDDICTEAGEAAGCEITQSNLADYLSREK